MVEALLHTRTRWNDELVGWLIVIKYGRGHYYVRERGVNGYVGVNSELKESVSTWRMNE